MLAIKQTLYRTSRDSPVVAGADRGRRARQAGRRPGRAQGELRRGAQHRVGGGAREAPARTSPTAWSGYKTHAKVSLVVRQEPRRRCAPTPTSRPATTTPTPPSSTPTSASSPAIPVLGADTAQLFNLLTSGHLGDQTFEKLLVAPVEHAPAGARADRREVEHQRAGRGGPDRRQDELARGSADRARRSTTPRRAGVEIDLIVRGVCRLRPGVPGRERDDPRALDRRALPRARAHLLLRQRRRARSTSSARPTGCRATSTAGSRRWCRSSRPALRAELQAILDLQLADNRKAWELEPRRQLARGSAGGRASRGATARRA